MNIKKIVNLFMQVVKLSLFISVMSPLLFTCCTPFKMEEYKECTSDSDCIATFERCDLYNFCINEGSLCYWQLSDGTQTRSYEPQSEEIVIGLLAEHELVTQSGQAWPAVIGLQTGAAMTQGEEAPSPTILICEPKLDSREKVLETFKQYGVKTVIGTAHQTPTNTPDFIYISVGFSKESEAPNDNFSHITLGSTKLATNQAFETLSSSLLQGLSNLESSFISMLALKMNNTKYTEDFTERVIWRLSPYKESDFRTLIVSFEELFKIDDVIIDFLNNISPLQFFVSLDPLKPQQLANLIETAQRKTTTSSTSLPLKFLAYKWRVDLSSIELLTFWPKLAHYTVISGQYPNFYPYLPNQSELGRLFSEAKTKAISLDLNLQLPAPYFGLAYDAGVLAGLIHKLSSPERSTFEVFTLLTQRTSAGDKLYMNAESILAKFNNGESAWEMDPFILYGLSGAISSANSAVSLAPLMLCSQNGANIKAIPFTEKMVPEKVGEDKQEDEFGNEVVISTIYDHFEISEELLNSCLD